MTSIRDHIVQTWLAPYLGTMLWVVSTYPRRPGRLTRALGGVLLLGFLRARADQELDAEHPEWTWGSERIYRLRELAVQIATDVPGDAEAVAAIQALGGRPKDWRRAAAVIRADGFAREHRNDLRAARLLQAAANRGTPAPPSRDEEALLRAVDSLEALPPDEAFAVLASEVPALRDLEQQIVTSLSEPGWNDRDAYERADEIVDNLSRLVGPRAPAGSSLIQSHTAFGHARVYLVGKAGLLSEDY